MANKHVSLPPNTAMPAAITAVVTTAPSNSTPYGFTTSAQAASLVSQLNLVIAALQTMGITL